MDQEEGAAVSSTAIERGDVFPAPTEAEAAAATAEAAAATAAATEAEAAEASATEEEAAAAVIAEEAAAAAEALETPPISIPKGRFDEAQAKSREREALLQAEIDELHAARTPPPEIDPRIAELEGLQDQYEDLLIEGEKEPARAIRRQVETLRTAMDQESLAARDEVTRRVASEDVRYDQALTATEEVYSVLDPDNDAFDHALTVEVGELMDALVSRGTPRHTALQRASKYVLGNPAQPPAASVAATEAAEAEVGAAATTAVDEIAQQRERAARTAAAAAAASQPPDSAVAGDASTAAGKPVVSSGNVIISQTEFDQLDEAAKSRARGDTI